MSEVIRVDNFINTTLTGDAQLATALGEVVRCYPNVAPEGMRTGKYISYTDITSPVTNAVGGRPVFARPSYVVKVHGVDTGYQALKNAVDRVQYLLTRQRSGPDLIVDGYYVGKFIRHNGMRSIDDYKNVRIFWVGETYTTLAYPSEGYASVGN